MEKKNFAEAKSESRIQGLIDDLLSLFHTCNLKQVSITKLKEQLKELDDNNPYFYEIRSDYRENNKMVWRLAIIVLGSLFDYLLLLNAVVILCSISSLPIWLRYVIPPTFIIAEICVSYFTSLRKLEDSRRNSKKHTLLPYFLLFIIVGMSALVILYAMINFNTTDNGGSLLTYAIGTIVSQILFLAGSLMYHIVLIRHAVDIAEMFAYFGYLARRNSLVKKIEKLDKENQEKFGPEFIRDVRNLVENMESFIRLYPHSRVNFVSTMPSDLAIAVNKVMGRTVFQIEGTGIIK